MIKVEFRLSMPNVNTWNWRWTGEGRNYTITKNLTNKKAIFLGLDKVKNTSWHYHWSDGWSACVTATVIPKGERVRKSDGFCGYNWMVDEIIWYNEIRGKK